MEVASTAFGGGAMAGPKAGTVNFGSRAAMDCPKNFGPAPRSRLASWAAACPAG